MRWDFEVRCPSNSPDGRYRIITLGDSSFYGFGVNDAETFDVQLTAALQDEGRDVDSVNAAAGYSIAQHRVAMDEVSWTYLTYWCCATSVRQHPGHPTMKICWCRRSLHGKTAYSLRFCEVGRSVVGRSSAQNRERSSSGTAQSRPEGKVRRVPLP